MTLPAASPDQKVLVLGTALWGWGVDRTTAYRLLDGYLRRGGRVVDTASNYPIDKRPEDFGLAAAWIADWIASNGTGNLSVLVKVGATDNMGGSNADLSRTAILGSEAFFRRRFGAALAAIAVHWDSRGDYESDADLIAETVDAMATLHASGLSIGFSGVRRPDLYLGAAPTLSERWWIQVKENAMSSAPRVEYQKYFPKSRYLAYGINMGGVKRDPSSDDSSLALRGIKHAPDVVKRLSELLDSSQRLHPTPRNLAELALSLSYRNPALSGVLVGPRNMEQLMDTMNFWDRLKTESSASPGRSSCQS